MSGRRLVTSLIAQAASTVGVLVAIAAWNANTGGRIVLGALAILAFLVSASLTYLEYRSQRAKRYPTPARINRFMHDWISKRGRTVIFSNDMSWVSENVYVNPFYSFFSRLRGGEKLPTIKALLIEKARGGDLALCLPRPTPLSEELRAAGADVTTYAALGFVPTSRFTIVRYGQQGASVAIGRPDSRDVHRIETFSEGQHPTFALASDLVHLVRRYAEVHR